MEDRLKTANDLAANGVGMLLVNRPWNTGRDTHPGVVRIDSLLEIIDMVEDRRIEL